MLKRTCIFLLMAVLGQGFPGQARASEEVEFFPLEGSAYSTSSQGVVRLLCQNTQTGIYYQSRAVVLDLPGFDLPYDILLTARHAVVDSHGNRDCHVRGQNPDGGQVDVIIRSFEGPQFSSDFDNDWAVIQTAERLSPDLFRARAAVFSSIEKGQLSIISRSVELEPCDVTLGPEEMNSVALIFHNCNTLPGMSGAPMMAMINGQPFVVGLHLGQITMMNQGFRRYGVARRLNGEFLDALLKLTLDNTLK